MKISNSKKELARIISENGGWRNGEFAAQDGDGEVGGYSEKPQWSPAEKYWFKGAVSIWFVTGKVANHHQTILSRAEYFHLYPAPDTKVGITFENNTSLNVTASAKPTIEQLAADYRNLKDFAERKQQEADAAKADAEAKLAELVAAGKALGLVLSVAGAEPELVITDWRDLKVGDEIEMLGDGWNCDNAGKIGVVRRVEGGGYNGDLAILCDIGEEESDWGLGFKFIRRP